MATKFGLFDGLDSHSDCVGSGEVRPASGGDLESGLPYNGGGGQVVRDRTAGLSVPVLGVPRTPVYRWNPAYDLQLHHPRFLELVGAPESA